MHERDDIVAYVEAMAEGVPAIGSQTEPRPEEFAASGDGIVLVPPKEPEALAVEIDPLGEQTVDAYREVLER